MAWRGLLRVVDFQTLLTSQAILAEALAKAGMAHGQRSEETRTVREGYNLIAKVLWTRRAALSDVHDLAWLDHTVVSAGARVGKTWEGAGGRSLWERLASRAESGTLFGLVPPPGSSEWAELTVDAFGGSGPLKLERGVAGPIQVGFVTQAELKSLMDSITSVRGEAEAELQILLEDVAALSSTARRAGTMSVALVFAASSFEGNAAD